MNRVSEEKDGNKLQIEISYVDNLTEEEKKEKKERFNQVLLKNLLNVIEKNNK